jgi:hypothetical protein
MGYREWAYDYIDELGVAGEGVCNGASSHRIALRRSPSGVAVADGPATIASGGGEGEDGETTSLRVLQQPLPVPLYLSSNITNISSIQNMSSTDESSFRNRFTE